MAEKKIGAYEAKTHLPSLLRQVADGQRFTITRQGKPVARLIPYRSTTPEHMPRDVIKQIRKLRQGIRLGDIDLRELIDEGRQ
ncbi:MAG TPA: type II toxin-antitoxin system prevent-host-death family antitoxin [Gammaproteobacteria bacterium]|nr:type II toxin-antitoxin system prevent-host-death family antitoxin [Gammaproteobacteria bacterium]